MACQISIPLEIIQGSFTGAIWVIIVVPGGCTRETKQKTVGARTANLSTLWALVAIESNPPR